MFGKGTIPAARSEHQTVRGLADGAGFRQGNALGHAAGERSRQNQVAGAAAEKGPFAGML